MRGYQRLEWCAFSAFPCINMQHTKKVVWPQRVSFTIVQTLSARSISQHIHGASNSLDGRKIPMALLGPRLRS